MWWNIIENFQFDKPVQKLHKSNRLYQLIDKFTEVDLHPDVISNRDMGIIFEELLRKDQRCPMRQVENIILQEIS